MKNNLKEVPGFDELVFENRNKEYGAYSIRKSYNKIIIISLVAASLLGTSVVVIPFLRVLGEQHQTGTEVKIRYVQVQMDKMEPPKDELIVRPPSDPPPPGTQQSVKYVAPVVVDTILPTEKPQPAVAEVQATPQDNDQLVVITGGDQNEIITGQEGGDADEPFILVEVRPTFKGGDLEKFREWVQKRAVYPQLAQDNGIQGKVYLTFVVERSGSVSNVKIVRGVDKLLDDEAVKAIEASPKWSPGLQRGRPVRVRFSIFLNFSMH
jgi:protein TonB